MGTNDQGSAGRGAVSQQYGPPFYYVHSTMRARKHLERLAHQVAGAGAGKTGRTHGRDVKLGQRDVQRVKVVHQALARVR